MPKAPKARASVTPPAPVAVADQLSADPKRKQDPLAGSRAGKSSLTIQRNVGGFDKTGSGLTIGG